MTRLGRKAHPQLESPCEGGLTPCMTRLMGSDPMSRGLIFTRTRMRNLSLAIGSWLLLVTAAAAQAVPGGQTVPMPMRPPRDTVAAPRIGTGRIAGKVVAADTGAPVRMAQLML